MEKESGTASFGTPLKSNATKVLLCGAGELGKEVIIELQRLGIETIAVDRYEDAPAMQVAHRSHVISMLDGDALEAVIREEQPDFIVPEVEAIATDRLIKLEQEGFCVIPSAKATQLTMNREGIRTLAAETLELPTSEYQFADTYAAFTTAVETVGIPCVVKPIMSSSGKGQSLIQAPEEIETAWNTAQSGGRAGKGRVIVESFVEFDFEITLLTIRSQGQTYFCQPIGHKQSNGDYYVSWQPQPMSDIALQRSQEMADKVTTALGGNGLFGVELFIKGDDVIFSEVSPRPHDTGMVTMISQELSEFALHVRAILGLPIPAIEQHGPSASYVILGEGSSHEISYQGVEKALSHPNTQIRLFGKPDINGRRRLGVALARDNTLEAAIAKAEQSAQQVSAVMHSNN